MTQDPIRLLIVDDDESLREPLREFLAVAYNYHVTCAADGAAALEIVSDDAGGFDVLLIDQLLGGDYDGIEVMQRVQSQFADIESIIFTGYAADHRREALQSGAFQVIDKGQFDRDELGIIVRNAAQQVRLRQISRRVLGEHDMTRLLDTIAASAQTLTFADSAAIVVVERDQMRIYPDPAEMPHQWRRHLTAESLTARIMANMQPILVADTMCDPQVDEGVRASGVRTFLGVPIPGATSGLGVLYVYSSHLDRFASGNTKTLLQSLADQAGVAIANARAFRAREEAADEFRTIYQLGTDLSQSLDVDEALMKVAESGMALLKAERCTALLREQRSGAFVQKGVSVDPARLPPITVEPRPHGYTLDTVFAQGESYLLHDLTALPDYNQAVAAFGVRSTLGVPMKARGQVVGALFAHSNTPYHFTAHHTELLAHLASHAGTVLSNAQMYRASEIRTRLLTELERALRNVRSAKEPPKLLQEIVRLAVELLECDFGGLCRYRAGLDDVEMLVAFNFEYDPEARIVAREHGVIGATIAANRPQVDNAYGESQARDPVLAQVDVSSLMTMPLWHDTDLEGVLFVGRSDPARGFTPQEEEIFGMFAEQAGTSWQTSLLLGVEHRHIVRLDILHRISDFIQADAKLERVLHVTLTGITAGYGLGFNRAALFLLRENGSVLRGEMGIGELDRIHAFHEWAKGEDQGTEHFDSYLRALDDGTLVPTQLESIIPRIEFSVAALQETSFGEVLQSGHWLLVESGEELGRMPQPFVDAFGPAAPFAVVALRARNEVIGLLVVDNKFTRAPITSEDIDALKTFVNTASVAIDNTVLMEEKETAEARLRGAFAGSNYLTGSLKPEALLARAVEQARWLSDADSVSVVRIDQGGNVRELVSRGEEQYDTRTEEIVRTQGEGGMSMQVMRTGEPAKFEDADAEHETVNPRTVARGIRAGLCLPFQVAGETIGVMWLHYQRPHTFTQEQIDTYRLHANQAAVAYDAARRVRQLTSLQRAAESLADAAGIEDALRRIAESAVDLLRADSATAFWYDAVHRQLSLDRIATAGIELDAWVDFLQFHPTFGEAIRWIADHGALTIAEATDGDDVPPATNALYAALHSFGIACSLGIALRVGDLPIGVLLVNYDRARWFDDDTWAMADALASHAALALQNVRYVDQLLQARDASHRVAEMSALADVRVTMGAIVGAVKQVLGCDAVTLYTFDDREGKLGYPPTAIGVREPGRIHMGGRVAPGSIVHAVLNQDELYVVEDVLADGTLAKGGFVVREEIKSVVGIPLKAHGRRVGVMFASYRTPHHFSPVELANIWLFGYQTAVALHNAQLYEDMRRIKGYVGSRTATDWIKMVSLSWGHAIRREVGKAQLQTQLLRLDMDGGLPLGQQKERLAELEEIIGGIRDVPILAPLSDDEAVTSVAVDELLREHLTRAFAPNGRYNDVGLTLDVAAVADIGLTVRASSAWLRQAFDIVLDNAADAMRQANSEPKEIYVGATHDAQELIITFTDTGPGVPPPIRERLFQRPIDKPTGSRGAGIGLMQAQAIVETYGGSIAMTATGPGGTTFQMRLPLETGLDTPATA